MRPTSAACILLLCALTGGVRAQVAAPAASPPAQPAAERFLPTPDFTTSLLAPSLARELKRFALLEIRALETPAGDDYLATGYLLDLAGACATPTLQELRLRVDAAFNSGDADAVERASRDVIKLDPADTRTQSRLIAARIARLQTAEQRLAASDRLLGPDGAAIDPSVRSRIALDAALLAREAGDQTGYANRLKQAAQLDVTNKDAAVLLYQFFVESSEDKVGAAELLANLLYADPIDPAVHLMLRDAMLDVRAFALARRFSDSRANILKAANHVMEEKDVVENNMVIWLAQGADHVVRELETEIKANRDDLARQRAAADPAQREGMKKPEDFRIKYEFECIRLAASLASGNRAVTEASINDMGMTIGEVLQSLSKPEERAATMTEEQASAIMLSAMKDLQLWRLVAGSTAKAAADMPAFEAMKHDGESDLNLAKAWLAFRSGNMEEAATLLGKAESSSWGAILAAELAAAKGDKERAVALLLDVYSGQPLRPLGGFALGRVEQIAPGRAEPDAEGRRVAAIAGTIPKWLDGMALDPRLHQVLKAKLSMPSADARQPVTVDVSLTNISQLPLGLGSDRTLNSRLLFTPVLEGREGTVRSAEPEVMELGGRLRLMPGETVTLSCEPDSGVTGYLAGVWCKHPTRLRWRVLQGPEEDSVAGRAFFAPGPGCVSIATETLVRRGIAEALLDDTSLAATVGTATEDKWPDVAYAVRASLVGLTELGTGPRDPAGVARAISDRYPTLSPAARALTLCILPPTSKVAELAPFDLVVGAETEPRLQLLALLTRVTDPADPLVEKCIASADAAIKRVAQMHKARLLAGRQIYATRGVSAVVREPAKTAPAGSR